MRSRIACLNDWTAHDGRPAELRSFRRRLALASPLFSRPLRSRFNRQPTLIAGKLTICVIAGRFILTCRKRVSGGESLPSRSTGNLIAARSLTSNTSWSTTRTSLMRGLPNKATLWLCAGRGDIRRLLELKSCRELGPASFSPLPQSPDASATAPHHGRTNSKRRCGAGLARLLPIQRRRAVRLGFLT